MFYRPFREATKVIGISPVKDHNLCKATVTMKNWYGLLGNPRNQFHQNIHGIISDFALMMKPTLVIADGRKLLMRNGPTGGSLNDVKRSDTIVVGTDGTAVDSWCVTRLLEKHRARDHLPRQGDHPRPRPGLAAPVDAGDHGMSRAGARGRANKTDRSPSSGDGIRAGRCRPGAPRLRSARSGGSARPDPDLRLERDADGVLDRHAAPQPRDAVSATTVTAVSLVTGTSDEAWDRVRLLDGFTLPNAAIRGPGRLLDDPSTLGWPARRRARRRFSPRLPGLRRRAAIDDRRHEATSPTKMTNISARAPGSAG